jgi:hypothetical protein
MRTIGIPELSVVYVNNNAPSDSSTDNVLRGVWHFRESNDGADTLEGCSIQVARKPIPSGLS